ncbi:MAG: AAA family ATPase [Lachnospiraceae bacterium]
MNHRVIAISRQFGSGGREIGKKLSEELKIPFYDLAIIEAASKRCGANYNDLLAVDEKKVNSGFKWYQFTDESDSHYSLKRIPVNEELYRMQKEIIHDMADKSSCVIIGRGADYILRNNPKLLSVFVIADKETKVENVTKHYNLDRERALELMKKTDRQRRNYYNAYTDFKWGDVSNYNLVLDRGRFGIDGAVNILKAAYETL